MNNHDGKRLSHVTIHMTGQIRVSSMTGQVRVSYSKPD